jgi:hypothetical protein
MAWWSATILDASPRQRAESRPCPTFGVGQLEVNGKMFMLPPYKLVTSAWYSLRSYVAATMVGLY